MIHIKHVSVFKGLNKLVLPKVKATWHGLKSTVYTASEAWNSLSHELRSMTNIKLFRQEVRKISSFGQLFHLITYVHIICFFLGTLACILLEA